MGSFLDKPKTDKTNASGEGNNLKYGLSSMQGWRIEMEDAHCANIGLPGLEDWSFFAVFDGHAGARVSQYCSENLLKSILNAEEAKITFCETNNQSKQTSSSSSTPSTPPTTNTLTSTSSNGGSNSPQTPTNSQTNLSSTNLNQNHAKIKNAIIKGFLDLDESIRKLPEFRNGEDKSGSTAIACLISPNNIYLINCGDSRAIVCSNSKVVLNTNDHKPINPEERERIQKAGGSVMIQRVNGSLAVSRALGDFEYKMVDGMGPTEQLVSPEPEIYVVERCEKDEFIVLACDGVWDVMSNEDINEFIRYKLKLTSDLVQISNEVLDTCLFKGSRDNMSIIIVTLPGAPKVEPEDVEKEKKLNEKLENRIKELITNNNPKPDLSSILNTVSHEIWENLPPAGGFCAKQGFIEEIYHRLVPRNNEDDNNSNDPFGSPS